MAGIYTHIPFCYTRCSYCDFYKTTDQRLKASFINAICKEILLQKDFFNNNCINTLYFGGGTPSVLKVDEWKTIFEVLHQTFDLSSLKEITVEVNPDDVSEKYIDTLSQFGVNRVSMGVQSFQDSHLRKMNRRHNVQQAKEAIRILKQSPIKNVSIDLIYGLPYMSWDEWVKNINLAIEADVQHISAYHLTFEKGTPYYELLKKGQLKEIPEEISSDQFEILVEKLEDAGFENYEISNFAKPGLYSQHNSSYWTGEPYLGLGPSAHSFDGKSRRWNVRDIVAYSTKLEEGKCYWENEILTPTDVYNERIMLGLRTSKGFEVDFISQLSNLQLQEFAKKEIQNQINLNNLVINNGWCSVTREKKFITDRIISDLFYVVED
nr:radical SAM family heme chaperone HemW [uncultured Carboxylicivirga sp.]